MRIKFIKNFFFNRYISYKCSLFSKKSPKHFKLYKVKCDIVFFNLNSMKNKFLLASYLFFVDIFYYRAPLYLQSFISYRGKLQTKVTVLSSNIFGNRKINLFMKEFFFFIFLRNLDLKTFFIKSISSFENKLRVTCFFPMNSFFFTFRNLSFLNLPKNVLTLNLFFSNSFRFFLYSFFLLLYSFLFFLFEENIH